MSEKPTIIVAGLGRCGSSLTMQMLYAAGIPCLGTYPDFEDERTLRLLDADFVEKYSGAAMKSLIPYRFPLPEGPRYAIIWLDRDATEQAKSQVKMLNALGGTGLNRRARCAMASAIKKDRAAALQALPKRNGRVLMTTFERIIEYPEDAANDIAEFLHPEFDIDAGRMASVVIPRSTKCMGDMGIEEYLVSSNA